VGGLEHVSLFHTFGIIIPTDFLIFQRGYNHQAVMFFPSNMMMFLGFSINNGDLWMGVSI
jgi:hypothetical protein